MFLIVPEQARFSVLSDLIGGLQYCLWIFDHITARLAELLWVIACPLVPGFLGGSPNLSERLLRSSSDTPGSLLPESCFYFLLTEKVLTGCFPSI